MGKVLLAVAVAIASFIVAESLVCNKCTFGLLGFCMNAENQTCTNATNVCFTLRTNFPSLTTFQGFNIQGCAPNNTGCGTFLNDTFLGVGYNTNYTCCNATDRCNTVLLNAAPSSKMALSAAIGASILAFMFSM
ncbi:uncharacterized protein LOC101156901 [Oryzias latipes]|uniref:uncharacterized protein LOC101156901 n=1 Tax=Oryzias latipes TaxID=8090 RepID=UPI0000E9C265|nr:uncharacterized protein LOC101156901 [Oryzias latipes]